MTNETMKKETDGQYIIQGDNNVIQVGNEMGDGSGNVAINQLSVDLDDELRRLIDILKVEADDGNDKDKALRELNLVREQLAQAISNNPLEKRDAKAGLKDFAEKLKNGVGYVAQVASGLSTIGEKLPKLMDKISVFTDKL